MNKVNLEETLDKLTKWIEQYIVFPSPHCAPTIALWIAHTWRSTDFYTTPRLVFTSPVPGSGKTRGLELLALTCFNAKMTISSSTAAMFRRIGSAHKNDRLPPTILFDETDAIFGSSRPSETTEQLRGLMNSGYKRGATVDRCEGDASNMKVIEWPVYSPLALAGLAGKLPDTITTRAIMIDMKKRARGEKVKPFRERAAQQEVQDIVDALKQWAGDETYSLSNVFPKMPDGVDDRPAEVWEPLLSVAEQAGGEWPRIAQEACKSFVFSKSKKTPPLSIELLEDIRTVMNQKAKSGSSSGDNIKTSDLLFALNGLEESPWSSFNGGNGLTPRMLSQLLSGYNVSPIQFRDPEIKGKVCRGYSVSPTSTQAGLKDAWDRYLHPVEPNEDTGVPPESGTSATSATPQVEVGSAEEGSRYTSATPAVTPQVGSESVADTKRLAATKNLPVTSVVADVPDVADSQSGGVEHRAITDAVLNALDTTRGQSIKQIQKHLTKKQLDQVDDFYTVIEHLQMKGLIRINEHGRYVRKETA
ncbi:MULTISPECIES: DUF3631 domain-containing protein [Corynebacterium]|uniref:DUF3631 domain-containing protein n=1 Tax=Corynebacterium TaxID=1716 RepID=UPI001EF1A9E1|nr:DUF3631 domain-containing protein [Corynebacterium kefirresidentii]MCG7241451.1 DUF3631 domain-containing protein [Corynebacterium kefirresidentii]MCG7283620.1 DUF3631 domain-containing protein [Corynebacterium kefirresidentii]